MDRRKKLYIALVLTTIFWSGAFIAGKLTVPYIPTFSLTFLRFFFATIVLYFAMKGKTEGYIFEKKHIPIFLFTGIVGMFAYHVLFFLCLKYTTATNSSIIAAMNPIMTVVIGFIFAKQKISRKMLIGVALSFIGVLLTITGGNFGIIKTLTFNKGDIIMFMAVTAWSAYAVFSKCKAENIPPIVLTFASFVVCTVALIPFVIWENPMSWIPTTPISSYVGVLYMSIFSSVIGYLTMQIAIKEIGPARATVFANLVPVFSIFMAVIVLHEELQVIKLFTALIIIAGVVVCQWDGIKASEKVPQE